MKELSNIGQEHTIDMQESRQRSKYLDVVKAFLTILVVLGHCIQFGSGYNYQSNWLYFDNILFKAIYSFHMPAFMLISGYLFSFSIQKSNSWSTIISKIKTLLIPIFLWSLIPFTLSTFKLLWNNKGTLSFSDYFNRYVWTAVHGLWFLWAVFWCSIIVIVVNKAFKDNKIIYAVVGLLTFFTPDSFNLHLYKFVYPFFVIGYLYGFDGIRDKYKKLSSSNFLFTTSGMVFISMLTVYTRESYIYNSLFSLLRVNPVWHFYVDIYRFCIGLIGSLFVMLCIEKIYKFLNERILSFILCVGTSSMGIYIISGYIIDYFLMRITCPLETINYLITILETVIVLIVSLFLTLCVKKVKVLNKFLLGGRA